MCTRHQLMLPLEPTVHGLLLILVRFVVGVVAASTVCLLFAPLLLQQALAPAAPVLQQLPLGQGPVRHTDACSTPITGTSC